MRKSFEKIVWVSVGQEPDIRELQGSIHFQLTKQQFPEEIKNDAEILQTLRDVAKGLKVLLVADDIWDPKHEKLLNCIDPDNASRLCVTTRIRGLMKNASEIDVGVLSQAEALKLLLSSADMDASDVKEGSDELRIATDIVELCGRLPLTLAIAGGMVADCGMGFSEDIAGAMKERHELEDGDGMTVEARVISTSVKMLVEGAGKNKDVVLSAFKFFAVFPEDVPVPAAVFTKMAPLLTDEKTERKARLAVGSSLSSLLKYSLVKGSLSAGGIFMHDIVRDYVINQHLEDDLRALQRSVVDKLLAARPEPDGFPMSEHAVANSFESYVARQLYWHMRGALAEEEQPPDAWIAHPDIVVMANLAMAVGVDALLSLSKAREGTGELVGAAQASWAASWMKGIDGLIYSDLVYRTADLLEAADDSEAADFESRALSAAFVLDMGSERNIKSQARSKLLGSSEPATFARKAGAALASYNDAIVKLGSADNTGETEPDIEAALNFALEHNRFYMEAGELSDTHGSWRSLTGILMHEVGLGCLIGVASRLPQSLGTTTS